MFCPDINAFTRIVDWSAGEGLAGVPSGMVPPGLEFETGALLNFDEVSVGQVEE